jgi:2-hydroxy-6-oxonona-2,4-dienedioate hydrolase
MSQRPTAGGDGTTRRRGEDSATATDFEAAERALFEDVGLETRSQFVDLADPQLRTRIVESGPDDGDVPLVFVHGTAEFCGFLSPLMAQFDERRLLTYDRPGFGLSDPFDYTDATLRGTNVAALESVLDALDLERVDLVGHSMGGYTGIHFALARPERVRTLSLVGSVPTFPGTRPPLPFRLLTVPILGSVLQRLQKPG